MRLFDIAQDIERLLDASVGEGGEINEEALVQLEALEGTRDAKVLATCRYLIGQEAEADAIEAQATALDEYPKRLRERAQIHRNHAARLKRYVESNVPVGTKIADDCVSISWRRSEKLEVDVDALELPVEYCRVKYEPMKPEIKEAIKRGETVYGCRLTQRMNLVVK